jgi:pSer/pThr/pTyr-binding forkhead associated (FHA) protein
MWLVVVANGRPERAVEVVGDRFLIGRDRSCGLVLEDGRVSREHAAIVPGPPGRRLLIDLESANGTFVNGRPIPAPVGFRHGPERAAELWGEERLQFGDTVVVATTQDPRTFIGPPTLAGGSAEAPPPMPPAPADDPDE